MQLFRLTSSICAHARANAELKAGVGVDENFQSRREGYTGTDSHAVAPSLCEAPAQYLDRQGRHAAGGVERCSCSRWDRSGRGGRCARPLSGELKPAALAEREHAKCLPTFVSASPY
jgi:hypothetical protein